MKQMKIVVSGLPRSGTSLMMQILERCGYTIQQDYMRVPDSNNPNGYYEDERVKRLHLDHSWVDETEGKAIKVVSSQLWYFPLTKDDKVIYMHRDLDEVIQSQNILAGLDSEDKWMLKKHYINHIRHTLDRLSETTQCLNVDHRELLTNTVETLSRLFSFLDISPVMEDVISVVDTGLWRNRK